MKPHNYDNTKENTKRIKNSFDSRYNKLKEFNNRRAEDEKSVMFYIMHPETLRKEYPSLHYVYLCLLVVCAFIALFIIPIAFGMVVTIGGIGTPFVLSIFGSFFGL